MGRFLPGERLKIRNVAADMGVGQMPVRAALQRLAAEGALINVPNAGVTVPRLSLPEFDDLLQMRMMLEGEASERGIRGQTSADEREALREEGIDVMQLPLPDFAKEPVQ